MPTPRLRRHVATAVGALTVVLGATITYWAESEADEARIATDRSKFDQIADQAATAIENRIDVVAGVLRGSQAFFQSSNLVTYDEWRDFVAILKPVLKDEGVRFLAYVVRASPGGLEDVALSAAPSAGGFEVRPRLTPPVNEHRIFLFVEPAAASGDLVGFDLATLPKISERLDRAAALDAALLTPQCPVGPQPPDGRTVALCQPVFPKGLAPPTEEGRRTAVRGWIVAGLSTSEMIDAATNTALAGIDVELYDSDVPSPATLLYDRDGHLRGGASPAERSAPRTFKHQVDVEWKDRTWTARFSSLPAYESTVHEDSIDWIPWIGAALTLLSSALVWSLARTRAVALALADERSAEARNALAEVELQRDRLRAQSVELERARDEALAAARLKSEFIATVSHEIRTPMNGIVGMTSLLVESPLLPEQREYASHIRRSADQLLAIVNDLLDFSKLEAGRLRVESVPFDIRAACEESIEAVRPLANSKHLQIRLEVGAAVPARAVGDALRIRQVLVNLIANAVKFSSAGEILVQADAPERNGGEILLRFRVRDHGIGIAAEVLPLLFQPFTQAEASTTRRFGGSGLGLAISKRLVELMGGRIGAESRLGEGSTFEFSLRLPV